MRWNKAPMEMVKARFGTKDKLVAEVMALVEKGKEDKADLEARLVKASNAKLLHLHDVLTEIKEKYGTPAKLVDTVLKQLNRLKDEDYKKSLLTRSPAQLLSFARSVARKK
jgi:hypothetical protein